MTAAVQKLRRRGRAALKAGRIDESVEVFEQVVVAVEDGEPNPQRRSRDHLYLGVALFRAARHDEANQAFETCVRIDPNDAAAQYQIGVLAMHLGQTERAVDAFRIAGALAPDKIAYHLQHAEAALALGRTEEAEPALDAALKLDPGNFDALIAKRRIANERSGLPAARGQAPLREEDFAGVQEFIQSRTVQEEGKGPRFAPPPPSTRSIVFVVGGAILFLVIYLYLRALIGF